MGESQVFGPDVLRNAKDQVRMIRENLRVAQTHQKSYADNRRRELVFEEGDYVYLKVSPMRSVKRFNMKGKQAPRYVGPFKVLKRSREDAELVLFLFHALRRPTDVAELCRLPPSASASCTPSSVRLDPRRCPR